jgi:methylated-DNA-protein-cysteine methyltransferase-like protein
VPGLCTQVKKFQVNSSTQGPFAKSSDFDNWVKAVWQVVAGIPRGHVLTYGEVARLAGMSRAARRVSLAMRRAPRSMKLPWHRVINAQGKISFPQDSSGYQRQKELLQQEGVVFLNGKIDLQRFGYQGALDQLLWGEPL